jgi:hypothetical protein
VISGLPESRGPLRKLCGDLVRRIRLLSPLLDEIRDGAGDEFPDLVESLGTVYDALVCARDVLCSVYDGSKIYQVVCQILYAYDKIESIFWRFDEGSGRPMLN